LHPVFLEEPSMNDLQERVTDAVPDLAGVIFRRDLAKILNLSCMTLMRWEAAGRLPPSKAIGPRLRGWSRSTLIEAGLIKE
jgi:predicted DNA-binding transcriptional regulator AlpA